MHKLVFDNYFICIKCGEHIFPDGGELEYQYDLFHRFPKISHELGNHIPENCCFKLDSHIVYKLREAISTLHLPNDWLKKVGVRIFSDRGSHSREDKLALHIFEESHENNLCLELSKICKITGANYSNVEGLTFYKTKYSSIEIGKKLCDIFNLSPDQKKMLEEKMENNTDSTFSPNVEAAAFFYTTFKDKYTLKDVSSAAWVYQSEIIVYIDKKCI